MNNDFHGMENSPVIMSTASKEFAIQFSLDPLSSFLLGQFPHLIVDHPSSNGSFRGRLIH